MSSVGLWDFGIKAISEGLIYNTTVTELDLRNNRIGGHGGAALSEVLRKNTTLLRIGIIFFFFDSITNIIDLRWNNLGLLGGKAIAEGVKHNHSLVVLDLAGNDIPEEYTTAIGNQTILFIFI